MIGKENKENRKKTFVPVSRPDYFSGRIERNPILFSSACTRSEPDHPVGFLARARPDKWLGQVGSNPIKFGLGRVSGQKSQPSFCRVENFCSSPAHTLIELGQIVFFFGRIRSGLSCWVARDQEYSFVGQATPFRLVTPTRTNVSDPGLTLLKKQLGGG